MDLPSSQQCDNVKSDAEVQQPAQSIDNHSQTDFTRMLEDVLREIDTQTSVLAYLCMAQITFPTSSILIKNLSHT